MRARARTVPEQRRKDRARCFASFWRPGRGTPAAIVPRMTFRTTPHLRSRLLTLLGALALTSIGCDDAETTTSTGQGGDASTSTSVASSSSSTASSTIASTGTGAAAASSWALSPGSGEGARVVTATNGDPIFVGSTSAPTDFGLGEKQAGGYVVRTDRAGKPLWSRALASNGQVSMRVADSRDGLVVVGGVYNDAISFDDGTPSIPAPAAAAGFLVGFDEAGKVLFTRTFASTTAGIGSQRLVDVSISPTGKIALLASLVGTVDFGDGPTACDPATTRLLIYSTSNAFLATRVAPIGSLASVVTTATDDTYAVGRFNGTVQVGAQTLTSNGAGDAVVIHLSPTLELADVRTFGGAGEDGVVDAVALPGGGIAAVGVNDTAVDFGVGSIPPGLFYLETDAAAAVTKSRRFAAVEIGQAFPFSLAMDPAGGYAVTGYTLAAVDLGAGSLLPASYDAFFALYDATGAVKDAFLLGNTNPDGGPSLRGLALTTDDAFLAGSLASSANVGGVTVSAPDGGAILHARLVR